MDATKLKKFNEPVLVTRPYLPDLEEFKEGLEEIWANQWLTNNGPMLKRFQAELAEYLGRRIWPYSAMGRSLWS